MILSDVFVQGLRAKAASVGAEGGWGFLVKWAQGRRILAGTSADTGFWTPFSVFQYPLFGFQYPVSGSFGGFCCPLSRLRSVFNRFGKHLGSIFMTRSKAYDTRLQGSYFHGAAQVHGHESLGKTCANPLRRICAGLVICLVSFWHS